MRNQKLETKLAYKSALRQCGVITDLSHFIHNQRCVLFVAHKEITVRTSRISSRLSHIFLMYSPITTGVSREGRKITTRKHLTISFGAQRNLYKTDKIAFLYFKKIHFGSNQRISNASVHTLFTFCGSSL